MMALKHRKETPIRVTLPRVVVLVDDGSDVEKVNGSDAAKKKTAGTRVHISFLDHFCSILIIICFAWGLIVICVSD